MRVVGWGRVVIFKQKHPYCWWKKSCTGWEVVFPIICRVSYMSGGAEFLPSTAWQILLRVTTYESPAIYHSTEDRLMLLDTAQPECLSTLLMARKNQGWFSGTPNNGTPLWEWYGKLTIRGSHYWGSLESPLKNISNSFPSEKNVFGSSQNRYHTITIFHTIPREMIPSSSIVLLPLNWQLGLHIEGATYEAYPNPRDPITHRTWEWFHGT